MNRVILVQAAPGSYEEAASKKRRWGRFESIWKRRKNMIKIY